jgi:hypothetical protein
MSDCEDFVLERNLALLGSCYKACAAA